MNKFGLRLRELRLINGFSQAALAKKIGVSKSSVNMYERNEREPGFETLEAIADTFNVDLDYLLGKSDVKNRYPITDFINSLSPVQLPVFGSVPAGIPIEAIQDILDYEEISGELARTGEFLALRIKGESMEPRIREGDVVIIRRQEQVENGEVALIMVNGNDATVKKFYKTDAGVTLIGTNPTFTPLTFTPEQVEQLPVRVIGKVVELRAKF